MRIRSDNTNSSRDTTTDSRSSRQEEVSEQENQAKTAPLDNTEASNQSLPRAKMRCQLSTKRYDRRKRGKRRLTLVCLWLQLACIGWLQLIHPFLILTNVPAKTPRLQGGDVQQQYTTHTN